MNTPMLIFPIAVVLAGAGLAAITGVLRLKVFPKFMGLILSAAPLSAFLYILLNLPQISPGGQLVYEAHWFLNLYFSLYLDSLSAFFSLLVSFIGVLVVVYAGYYFKKDPGSWRFMCYILLFMGAMLGLVMAGDAITLFIFWEGTSIVSFLLVAYKTGDAEARRGAAKSLLITGGGGIALLMGLLIISHVAGDTRFTAILASGDVLRHSDLYLYALVFLALGAFTKSAQFPFHIWLPDAMSAPTPASAYLHSATMVKAGIYLMARMNPVMGLTEPWFWLLTLAGMATMLTGAVLALKRTDLKAILAYSTICQLGILMMMIGQDMAISFKALIIGILAHALYKSALFLVAGIVDHETGTRDITRLGGLKTAMPLTFGVASIAALSMAGLPPLFGFLAKETLLATAVHSSLPPYVSLVFTLSSVTAGAFMLAIAGRLVWDTFLGTAKDTGIKAHDPPLPMVAAPAIPAILSLILGQLPGGKEDAVLLADAASNAMGSPVKVSLALWHGLNIPLLLSAIAVGLGILIFTNRHRVIEILRKISLTRTMNRGYDSLVTLLDRAAEIALMVQQGRLRFYLATVLSGTLVLVVLFNGFPPPVDITGLAALRMDAATEISMLKLIALFLVCGTAFTCVMVSRDLDAILALGASGLGVAVLMALEPATDVALVQIVSDILMVMVLVLALARIPRAQLVSIQSKAEAQRNRGVAKDALIAGAFGLVVMLMALSALLSRPRETALSGFFNETTKPATGSTSIVGTILTDFRGLDTLFEICVFAIAGLGIYTLIRRASVHLDERVTSGETAPRESTALSPSGPLLRVLAHMIFPLTLVVGISDVFYGHDLPGDGFTAGVIISIGIGFQYVVFGFTETRKRLPWLSPSSLAAWGLLLALATGLGGLVLNGAYMSPANFGKLLGISLPKGIYLNSSTLFEVAICLGVVGSVNLMFNALEKPRG